MKSFNQYVEAKQSYDDGKYYCLDESKYKKAKRTKTLFKWNAYYLHRTHKAQVYRKYIS